MYWCIDGILTCPEVRSVGPAGLRRPWVPQLEVQDGPRYLDLGPRYLNLGPPDRS